MSFLQSTYKTFPDNTFSGRCIDLDYQECLPHIHFLLTSTVYQKQCKVYLRACDFLEHISQQAYELIIQIL